MPTFEEEENEAVKAMLADLTKYIESVGQVAFSWNTLQESLGQIFVIVVGAPEKVSLAIWYSTPSDRTQHKMLKDALAACDENKWPKAPRAMEDLAWLIERATNLADTRNIAIHAPVHGVPGKDKFEIVASYFRGHPLAKRLADKDSLMGELEYCARWASHLHWYADALKMALADERPWPDRPPQPTRPGKATRQDPQTPRGD